MYMRVLNIFRYFVEYFLFQRLLGTIYLGSISKLPDGLNVKYSVNNTGTSKNNILRCNPFIILGRTWLVSPRCSVMLPEIF
jgi:hypothetical protein